MSGAVTSWGRHGYKPLPYKLDEKVYDNHVAHIINSLYNANLVLLVRFLGISEEYICL